MSTTARLTRTKKPTMKPSTRRSVAKRDGNRCAQCGCTQCELTLDHIVPLSRGGRNRLANLQLLCRPCNDRKGDRLPDPDSQPTRAERASNPNPVVLSDRGEQR